MKIRILGFNGRSTGATLTPEVGMVFNCGVITKVNKKTFCIKYNNNTESSSFHFDEKKFTLWDVGSRYKHQVILPDGSAYQPTDVEQAIITLCEVEHYLGIEAIGCVAEMIVENNDLKKESVQNVYGSMSEYAVAVVIHQMISK